MSLFVLEIGFEEMPARFLKKLEKDIAGMFSNYLKEKKVYFNNIQSYSTPRRLIVLINNIASKQETEIIEVIGPPLKIAKKEDGSLTKAGLGFIKSQGVSFEDAYEVETSKGSYLAVKKQIGGQDTIIVLQSLCPKIIENLHFPKKMRWVDNFTFGRPIRWVLALFEDKIVNFQIAGLKSSNITYGHRVMGKGPFKVEHASELSNVLETKGKIILNFEERKKNILHQGNLLAKQVEGEIAWKNSLLEEVCYLVEYPKPILGKFDEKFLELPEEVLLMSMESHQKSFGVKANNKLLPYFLTIINLEPEKKDIIQKGWERVLKARLEDASFFWHTDLKSSFNKWLQQLEKVTFLGPLGSMRQKATRLSMLMEYLGKKFYPQKLSELKRAGLLAKCDLVSEMVGEFADLEGIMGGIYARKMGEDPVVATAIYEHYLPKGQGNLPQSLEGALLSIADKIDTLVGCFGLNIIPTGAADPYALRRNALGIIQIVLDKQLSLSLSNLISYSYDLYENVEFKLNKKEFFDKLNDFFAQRLKYLWQEQGFKSQIVEAALGASFDNIFDTFLRLKALNEFSKQAEFETAVLTFKRVSNIIKKQAKQETFFTEINVDLLEEPAEQRLYEKLKELETKFKQFLTSKKYKEFLNLLLELKPFVDDFFDNVMVMCENENLRKNRLTMLKSMTNTLEIVADFAALQV
ncbi:glycyl-tRNA synthetase beta chain [Desulfonauticus submarinus]|uniref:Glycine--tRNA ligase beta subunit n=1 Tax=Desulfonauticus submarinus TaxID=206665 RepID=A0A1H0A4J9_9BACT|nr:glycine--tRNA ligase subunit beta [Desulfonauticus submarinus]SDN28151.1 glycyl-tRNA synthetase beta chain [Desulfonauticus submarinus]